MNDPLSEAVEELKRWVEHYRAVRSAKHRALFAAQDEYNASRETFDKAESALQNLTDFCERLESGVKPSTTSGAETGNIDRTRSDVSLQEDVQ